MQWSDVLCSYPKIVLLFASICGESSVEKSSKPSNSDIVKPGVFETHNFWDVSDKPVMANGQIGFIPFGDSVYMNGLYNGYKGKSHRARIPNYANIQFESCSHTSSDTSPCKYTLDVLNGVFRTETHLNDGLFTVQQTQYAHRYYDMAIVNHIQLRRNQQDDHQSNAKLQLHLSQNPGGNSEDLLITSKRSIIILDKSVVIVEAITKVLEDPDYQKEFSAVSILYEQIPEMIELLPKQTVSEFTWIMIVQSNSSGIEQTFEELHERQELLAMHTNEWQKFWNENRVIAEGNDELSDVIDASIYALTSALPSLNTSKSRSRYFGLSPSGLGVDKLHDVYQGHSFWDTEIWMHPTILLLEPSWSEDLLNYRYDMRNTAHDLAKETGYNGFRYPWESAFTGIDVTQPEYPEIFEYQQHITADIGHALRKHFFATHNFEWLQRVGCDLAYGTAQFWASRVSWNESSQRYDIEGIMGPDEDHCNITNNAYTNVVAALNLHFGSYASCVCNQLNASKYLVNTNWASIAERITLLYDRQLDYNPQYAGYNLNTPIKQADVALLGYPLQYSNMQASTRRNNLHLYANVTRANGPAMTWSMHLIGQLEVDSTPPSQKLFERTYSPYVRLPFHVWNEYVNGVPDGASNFITGAGGFLQTILYGYAGLRINDDSLSIHRAQLPPNTLKLRINGISYVNSRFSFEITHQVVRITILHGRSALLVYIDGAEQDEQKIVYHFNRDQKLMLQPKKTENYVESCDLPVDTVDQLNLTLLYDT